MLARHIRLAGVRLIETALSPKHADDKHAFQGIQAATPEQLRAKLDYKLKAPKPAISSSARAAIPKVVTTPST
jgi:hypothetical protein